MSSFEEVRAVIDNYHRFDDGLLLSFEVYYRKGQSLSASLLFFSRNHSLPGDEWRNVTLTVHGVKEVCTLLKSKVPLTGMFICCGVKLLYLEGDLCVDVDGAYDGINHPSSLQELRRDGTFFLIGESVAIREELEPDSDLMR